MLDLVPLWAGILSLAVLMYVLLDGFDLGVGALFALRRDERDRNLMMASVAPIWDFNETWLILGGGGLLAAFPLAFAIIMPALYFPILVMLLGLLFRGVAFEFREIDGAHRRLWNAGFAYGSLIAAYAQGIVLGSYVQGFPVEGRAFAGTSWDWIAPFPLTTGAGLVVGYALLGATWLVMKTEGAIAATARARAKVLLGLVIVSMVVISLWTPIAVDRIMVRWFSLPNFILLAPIPLMTALAAYLCWRGLERGDEVSPFLSAVALFLLGFLGLVVSNAPYLVPPTLTVWQAAAPPNSQIFMLVGVLVMLPVILGYTVFVYWTFRGKVREGEGYH